MVFQMKKSLAILLCTLLVCAISTSYGGRFSVIEKAVKKAEKIIPHKESDRATKELEEFLQKRKLQEEELDAFIQKRNNINIEPKQRTKNFYAKDFYEEMKEEEFDVFFQKRNNGSIGPEQQPKNFAEESKGIEKMGKVINDAVNSPIGRAAMRKALRNSMEAKEDDFYNQYDANFRQAMSNNWKMAYAYYDKRLQNRIDYYIIIRFGL